MLVGKTSFLKYTGSPLSVREKDVNNFKSKIFSAKYLEVEPEPDVYDKKKKKIQRTLEKELYGMKQI